MKAFTEQMIVGRWPKNITDWRQGMDFLIWANGFITACLETGAAPGAVDDITLLIDMIAESGNASEKAA